MVIHLSKIKRIIAGLLAALNILTIMPLVDTGQLMDAAYADNGTHVGNTDGDVVVTGSGTWSSYAENVGYRMWLMDEDGNFVAEAGIADLRNEELPNKSFNMTTNVKIQKWTGEDAGNTIHKQMLFDNLIGVKNRLPKPMEAPSKGNYVGNGDAFTYWLTEGKADINAGGSGGGGIHHTYKPGGNKGPTGGSTGGSSGGSSGPSTGGPTGGSTGGSTGNTQPTVGSATQQLGKTYSNALAYVNAHRANITRSYAIQYVQACIKAKRDELCKGLTGTERHPIIDAAAEYIDMVYRELSENGWKSTDASRLINTEDQTLVAREVKMGRMTPEQAERDPRRNVLLQCIGASKVVEPTFICGNYNKNECYMLCSDGFRHVVTANEIQNFFAPSQNSNEKIMKDNIVQLIELNKERQETDNISSILIKII